MFTREDYFQYFQEISLKEREMLYTIHDLVSLLEDKKSIPELQQIADDSVKHYSLTKLFIDSINVDQPTRRRWERLYSAGDVIAKNVKEEKVLQARCVDWSFGGLRLDIEADKPIELNEEYEFYVHFYDKTLPIKKHGKIVWIRKIRDDLFSFGVEFVDQIYLE